MRQIDDDGFGSTPANPVEVHSLGELVASRLRAARKAAGLTLLDVSRTCGTTPQTIQRLETNNMTLSIDWVERIARAVDIEPHMIFADLESPLHVFERRVQLLREEAKILRTRTEGFLTAIDGFLAADEAAS